MKIEDFYNSLKDQRYLSIIIHSKPNSGLSEFARKASGLLNAKYFDLYEYFLNKPELSEDIDGFSEESLMDLLHKKSKDVKLLFVDNIDFLLDTWTKEEMKSFLNRFNNQWDTWKSSNRAGLFVFMETDEILKNTELKFQNGENKIYKLSEFSAI